MLFATIYLTVDCVNMRKEHEQVLNLGFWHTARDITFPKRTFANRNHSPLLPFGDATVP
jgi:hypothetical protein